MKPSQIITGSANLNPSTFSSTHFNEDIFYAYSSGRNVHILKGGSLKVVQVLTGHQSDVQSLSWLSSNSIVVGGNQLAIWKLDFDLIVKNYLLSKPSSDSSTTTTTTNKSGTSTPNIVATPIQPIARSSAVDMKAREQSLFNKQAQITWKIDCSQPIHYISCSPDGTLFATAGKVDRMLKVWYLQKKVVKKEKESSSSPNSSANSATASTSSQPQTKDKGYFREEFNKLTQRGPIYKPSKPAFGSTEDDDLFNQQQLQNQQQELQQKQKGDKKHKFELESYGFIYLPHPRSITWISWRSRRLASHNILLTNCKDGVVRLWQQSLQSRRLQFNVSNIIPSGSDTIDWVYCLNDDKKDLETSNTETDNSNNNDKMNGKSATTAASTTSPRGVKSNNNQQQQQQQPQQQQQQDNIQKLNLNNPILQRQKESLAKTKQISDWIIGIKADGWLILWKLKTDDSMTKQTSSISIWINAQVLSPQEVGPNRIIALYDPVSLTDNTPRSIKVCFNSTNGISCRRFFIQSQNHTQISNTSPISRCFGHRYPIKEVNVAPASPYLSSVDQQNNVILWQATDSSKIQSPSFLTDVGTFSNTLSTAWSPSRRFFFSSNQQGIFIYQVEEKPLLPVGSITSANHPQLENETIESIHVVEPMKLIYSRPKEVIDDDDDDSDELNGNEDLNSNAAAMDSSDQSLDENKNSSSTISLPFDYFVIGLNKEGDKVYVWGISIKPDLASSSTNTPILTSQLLATKEFERFNRITCMCAAPSGISDGGVNCNSDSELVGSRDVVLTMPIFVTGNIEGFVSVWGITPSINNRQLSDWKIHEMATYGAYQQPVESVKPAYFGRFASTPFTTNPNPEIHIWELESHTPKLKLEDTIKFYLPHEEDRIAMNQMNSPPAQLQPVTISLNQDTVQVNPGTSGSCRFGFSALDNGSYTLAIGYENTIKIMSKPTDRTIGSYKKPWVPTHTYSELNSPCSSIEWGKDHSLYATAGNELLVFSKWNRPSDEILATLWDGSSSSVDTIYHQQSELTRSLPFYHPKFLTEYMMAGKFTIAEKILGHISKFLFENYSDPSDVPKTPIHIPPLPLQDLQSNGSDSTLEQKAAGTSDDVDKINQGYFKEKKEKKPKEIKKIDYSDDDREDGSDIDQEKSYHDDEEDEEEEDEDDFLNSNSSKFTKRQANKLSEILSWIKLSNLSHGEQIQLLAVTDTYGDISEMRGGLDENGSRFMLVAKIFQFLIRSMNPKERPVSLSTTDILWALHSEAQEAILQSCFPVDPDWEALRQIGAGLWIKSPSTLRNVVEKLAKTTYLVKKDPSDCSLYYLALKKKGALVALHKAAKDQKHVDFLSQDFTQPKWITAAAKSAFLLQSKHKYELAASLFLLAGQLKQAVNLILQILGDFQLALVISRLFEGEGGEISKMIIEDHIIPHAKKTNDRSLLSIANWLLKKYEDAFLVLIPSTSIDNEKKLDEVSNDFVVSSPPLSGSSSPMYGTFGRGSSASSPKPLYLQTPQQQQLHSPKHKSLVPQLKSSEIGPSVLYFFRYLKNHTQVRQLADKKKKEDPFLRNSAYSYLNSGCPLLALESLQSLEVSRPKILSDQELEQLQKEKQEDQEKLKQQSTTTTTTSKYDDLGLDFGGGSTSSSYFNNNSNYDMGLDFGGGGSSSSYFKSNSNYDMGLDFGGGGSSSSSYFKSNTNDMGLDFGGGGSSSSYFKSNSNYDMGLDFGGGSSKPSNNYGLDFNDSSKDEEDNTNNNNNNNDTNTDTTSKKTSKKHEREKLSLFPIIDLELKVRLVLKVLLNQIVGLRESNQWDEKTKEFEDSLTGLCETHKLEKNAILTKLIQYCSNRQYFRQAIHFIRLLGDDPLDYIESSSFSILKSISRMDEYLQSKSQSEYVYKLAKELYSSLSLLGANYKSSINIVQTCLYVRTNV
eukprot:gene8619-10609_t